MTDEPDKEHAPGPRTLPGCGAEEGTRPVACRVCGQPLRDRVSRIWGLGPDCRAKYALRLAPAPPLHDVVQETLPGL